MDDNLYTEVGHKEQNIAQLKNLKTPKELSDYVKNPPVHINVSEVSELVCEELKKILDLENLNDLLEAIFHLDHDLSTLHDHVENIQELPTLELFYRELSPTLLRSVWESLNRNEDVPQIYKGWRESIRIAIEEELHNLQEKII